MLLVYTTIFGIYFQLGLSTFNNLLKFTIVLKLFVFK